MDDLRAIVVLGIKYSIKYVNEINLDSNIEGLVDYQGQIIYVKKGLQKEAKKLVIFHEIIHIILNHFSYFKENENEKFVQAIATGLHNLKLIKKKKYYENIAIKD